MGYSFTADFAGIPVGIKSEYEYMRNLCRDYLTSDAPLFSVECSGQQIDEEGRLSGVKYSPDYTESICLYREIAERMPGYGRAVFHGAAIEYEGSAFIFTAPSGTGKTTHIQLWRRFLGDKVKIINGDKPIIAAPQYDITVFGTPFAGKEGYQKRTSASLAALCFLSQGTDNEIVPIDGKEAFIKLFLQTYRPHDGTMLSLTADLVRRMSTLPCYSLSCDMTEQAVMASFEKMTGKDYSENKI